MKRTEALEATRKMRFEEIYNLRAEKRLTVQQGDQILGVDERTFRRWTMRYEAEGAESLADKRLGKMAHNAAPVDEVAKMLFGMLLVFIFSSSDMGEW